MPTTNDIPDKEPRWPAAVTVLAVIALHFALPSALRIGPPWIGAGLAVALLGCSIVASYTGRTRLNQQMGYLLVASLTVGLVAGVARLIVSLLGRTQPPQIILRSAAVLWAANVIVFALWYWRLDAGGPNERDRRASARPGAFLFPQMSLADQVPADYVDANWRPHFVDYLFLSFNTSTAFSPTDVPVLGRWAKVMCMTQSLISFTTIVVLVARAINTL